jgi:hypothetical protein
MWHWHFERNGVIMNLLEGATFSYVMWPLTLLMSQRHAFPGGRSCCAGAWCPWMT